MLIASHTHSWDNLVLGCNRQVGSWSRVCLSRIASGEVQWHIFSGHRSSRWDDAEGRVCLVSTLQLWRCSHRGYGLASECRTNGRDGRFLAQPLELLGRRQVPARNDPPHARCRRVDFLFCAAQARQLARFGRVQFRSKNRGTDDSMQSNCWCLEERHACRNRVTIDGQCSWQMRHFTCGMLMMAWSNQRRWT